MDLTTFDDPHQPQRPDEQDRLLDLRLAALPRFEPSPGFADRVMARVQIRRRAPATIPWYAPPWTLPAGIQRLAAALAIMAAASSSLLTLWAISNLQSLRDGLGRHAIAFADALLEASLPRAGQLLSFLADTGAAIAAGTDWPVAAAILTGSLAAIPLSMLGWYLISRSTVGIRSPEYTGRPSHARR